jgi:hypothetical protein
VVDKFEREPAASMNRVRRTDISYDSRRSKELLQEGINKYEPPQLLIETPEKKMEHR